MICPANSAAILDGAARHDCPRCAPVIEEFAAEIVELQARLALAAVDNNPGGVRNHERLGQSL